MAIRAMANVGSVSGEADVGLGGGLLDTDSVAGWSTIWAIGAAVMLLFLVGRGEGGLRRVVRVTEFVAIVALAMVVANYLVTAWVINADSDIADGLGVDLGLTPVK
jgi:EamA domain-containing membrane protein RarD